MNTTFITGNLGKDAEIITSKAGKKFMSFSVANNEKRGDETITTWFNCVIFNEKMVAGKIVDYLKKGTKVLVSGKYRPDIWIQDDGTALISHNFTVFELDFMGTASQADTTAAPAAEAAPEPEGNDEGDDLPF